MKKKQEIKLPEVTVLPSGAYHTRIYINGQRISITKPTVQECIAEYMAMKHGVKEVSERKRTGQITLEDALDAYIAKRQHKASPSTINGYLFYKKCRLQSMMHANVFEVTNAQWQAAVDRDFRHLSDKYAKNVWTFFAGAIKEATGTRPEIELTPPKQAKRPFLEPEEILIFVDAIKGRSIEIAALLELSSLRVSEVRAVRGTDVDFIHNRVRVHGANVISPNGFVYKDENKTKASDRYVPLIPPLREALEKVVLTDDYLVKMYPGSIYRHINKLCVQLGFPEVGNHGLRHSFASLAYHLGMPEKVVQEIGGWEDSKTVHDIYTHLSKKYIANMSQQYSNFFVENTAQNPVANGVANFVAKTGKK